MKISEKSFPPSLIPLRRSSFAVASARYGLRRDRSYDEASRHGFRELFGAGTCQVPSFRGCRRDGDFHLTQGFYYWILGNLCCSNFFVVSSANRTSRAPRLGEPEWLNWFRIVERIVSTSRINCGSTKSGFPSACRFACRATIPSQSLLTVTSFGSGL
jgi:hypothetical protein